MNKLTYTQEEYNKRMIKQRKEVRTSYYIKCPLCPKEIRGDSPKAALYNYDVHKKWHNKVKSHQESKKIKRELK